MISSSSSYTFNMKKIVVVLLKFLLLIFFFIEERARVVAVEHFESEWIIHDSNFEEQTEAEEHIRRKLLDLPNHFVYGIPAINPSLSHPWGVWKDTIGNLFVSDTGLNKILMLSPENVLSTFAGTGTDGFSGDGGMATAASLSFPAGTWGDSSGKNIFICDMGMDVFAKCLERIIEFEQSSVEALSL